MTMRTKSVTESFSMALFGAARVDIMTYTCTKVLERLPNATLIEITAIEYYDDGETAPAERTLRQQISDLKHVNAQLENKLRRNGLWDDPG